MLLEIVLISLALIVLLVASYTDIRTREVPDMISYGLIFAGLGIRGIFSIEMGWGFFVAGLLGFGACLLVALLFYHTHQWGGGDSKLLMGMGAVIGISLPFSLESLNLLWYFLAVLFLGAVYGLVWITVVALKNRKEFSLKYLAKIFNYRKLHFSLWGLTGALGVVAFLIPHSWIFIPIPLAIFYLFLLVYVIEEGFFIRMTEPSRLTEGDWLAEDVKMGEELVLSKRTLGRRDLDKLKEAGIQHVKVKEGIPFIPSFLFAYLVFIFGSEVFGIVKGLLMF